MSLCDDEKKGRIQVQENKFAAGINFFPCANDCSVQLNND